MKKFTSGLLALLMAAGVFFTLPLTANAATFEEINQSEMFLTQDTNYTCTLSAMAMMLRRRTRIDGGNWSAVTEAAIKPTCWLENVGVYWTKNYNGMQMAKGTLPADEASVLIPLLANHPEGVLCYADNQPHAVLVTDYDAASGIFYCADPWRGYSGQRIPLANSSIMGSGQGGKLDNLFTYCYISNRSGGLTEPVPVPGKPTLTITSAPGTGAQTTSVSQQFNWSWTDRAEGFDLRIWKSDGTQVVSQMDIRQTNWSVWLEPGDYRANVAAVSHTNNNWTFSDDIRFTITQGDFIPKKTIVDNGHVYSLYDDGRTWTDARAACEAMGGHLVSITSQAEQDIVQELLAYGSKEGYWIDGADTITEGTWFWTNNRENFSYTHWASGEPADFGNEDYAGIYPSGWWNDWPDNVDTAKRGFICEVDVPAGLTASYDGHRYLLMDNIPHGQLTWQEAKVFCERWGGHLVTITSKAEQDVVTDLLSKGGKDNYWLGATDETAEGSWKWVTDEGFRYTNWASDQPDNLGNQNYSQIYKSGKWDDRDPNSGDLRILGLLCEFELDCTVDYGKNKYQLFEQTMTWQDAKAYCESLGGHLATITSADEQAAVEELAAKGAINYYWLGAQDDNTNTFRWVTGESMSYTNWKGANPDNYQGIENYMHLYNPVKYDSDIAGKWNDNVNCTRGGIGFICEFEGYTVAYNANGGAGAPEPQIKTSGTPLTLSSAVPVRPGYTFIGWAEEVSDDPLLVRYQPGAVYDDNADVTLYAEWEKLPIPKGDVNGDGKVSAVDIMSLRKILLGDTVTDEQLAAGDLDGDGKLGATDIMRLRKWLLELEA